MPFDGTLKLTPPTGPFSLGNWEDREALMRVRDKLASGEIGPEHFDMSEPSPCGTASCIGGWCLMERNSTGVGILNRYFNVNSLFYPQGLGAENSYKKLSCNDAVRAIDNVLAGRDPGWADIRPDLVRN